MNSANLTRVPNDGLRSQLEAVVRWAYPPVMLIVLDGAAIALCARTSTEIWAVAVVLFAIGLSFMVERLIPYQREWNHSRGDLGRDIAHFLVNEAVNTSSVLALPLVAGVVPHLDLWPTSWPFLPQVLCALLAVDGGITLTHWASHRVRLLWRFHAVHHSVKRFYGFNGLMKHPLHQAIEMAGGVLPLVFLGLPQNVAAAIAACIAIQLLMQHSNAAYRVGRLKHLLALNEGHRFHHLKEPGAGDCNFGLFTNLWDRILGTWTCDPNRCFSSQELGIDGEPDFPNGYAAQILRPFRRATRTS